MKHKACRPWIDTTGDMLNRHPYFQVCLIWRSSHTGNPTIGLKLFPLFLIFKANVSIPSDDVVPSCRRCTTHCNMIAGQIRCFFNGRSVETAVNFSCWGCQNDYTWFKLTCSCMTGRFVGSYVMDWCIVDSTFNTFVGLKCETNPKKETVARRVLTRESCQARFGS